MNRPALSVQPEIVKGMKVYGTDRPHFTTRRLAAGGLRRSTSLWRCGKHTDSTLGVWTCYLQQSDETVIHYHLSLQCFSLYEFVCLYKARNLLSFMECLFCDLLLHSCVCVFLFMHKACVNIVLVIYELTVHSFFMACCICLW